MERGKKKVNIRVNFGTFHANVYNYCMNNSVKFC